MRFICLATIICNLSILQAAPGNLNPNPNLKQPSTRAITAEQLTGVALAVAMGVTETEQTGLMLLAEGVSKEEIEGDSAVALLTKRPTLKQQQLLLLEEEEIELIKSELRNEAGKKVQNLGGSGLIQRVRLTESRTHQIELLLELADATHTQQEIKALLQHLVTSLEKREQEVIIQTSKAELIKEMANRDIELLRQVKIVVETSKNQVGGEKTQNLLVVINNLLNSAEERFEALQVKCRKACKEREERLKKRQERLKRQNHQ